MNTFFGEPWPSGICEDGVQVPVPVGERCDLCDTPVTPNDQGSFMGYVRMLPEGGYTTGLGPVHRECSLREVVGGIGHLKDHDFWCSQMHDPNAGFSYRESALRVWEWVGANGLPNEFDKEQP